MRRKLTLRKKLIVLLLLGITSIAVLYLAPLIVFAVNLPSDCFEGMARSISVSNSRGDLAGEYVEACVGFGTVANYSIALWLHGAERNVTLIRFDEPAQPYPKLRWLTDDALVVELGKVNFVWSKQNSVGPIRISYVYTTASWRELIQQVWDIFG